MNPESKQSGEGVEQKLQCFLGRGIMAAGAVLAGTFVLMAWDARAQHTIDCGMYGRGYVAVQGTARCIPVRGRMRLNQPDNGFRGANFLPSTGAPRVILPQNIAPHRTSPRWR